MTNNIHASTSPTSTDVQPMFNVFNTPVRVKPGFLANLLALWAGMTWLSGRKHSERNWLVRMLAGALSAGVLILSDVGHAFAHTISARFAGAPVDEIELSAGMPRTIYHEDHVPPRAHRMRAMGGPLFSALGLGISLLVRQWMKLRSHRGCRARFTTKTMCPHALTVCVPWADRYSAPWD